jgi:hypothetical protein
MAGYIDRALALLKWPVAILALLTLPGLYRALASLTLSVARSPAPLYLFLLGLTGYLAAWWLVLRRPSLGSWFSTLEHELTHALFALLTFHRVTGLSATWRSGGRVTFLGRGNWLISLAPYFFPTLSAALLIALWLAGGAPPPAAQALLGATVGYHAASTTQELHRHQPDLKQVGLPFALCLLPPANLLALGYVVSFAQGGAGRASGFIARVFSASWAFFTSF